MEGKHNPMLSLSMRMLWLKVSYAVVLISSSGRVLGRGQLCPMGKMAAAGHLHSPCLMDFCATSSFLYPPNEQEVLQDLVFQPTLLGGILEEFNGVLHSPRLEVGGRASAKGQTDAVAQCVPSRFGELNCPQTVAVQVPVCVKDCFLGHCRLARNRASRRLRRPRIIG